MDMSKAGGAEKDISPRVHEIFRQMQSAMAPPEIPGTNSNSLSPRVQSVFREMRDITHTPVFKRRG